MEWFFSLWIFYSENILIFCLGIPYSRIIQKLSRIILVLQRRYGCMEKKVGVQEEIYPNGKDKAHEEKGFLVIVEGGNQKPWTIYSSCVLSFTPSAVSRRSAPVIIAKNPSFVGAIREKFCEHVGLPGPPHR